MDNEYVLVLIDIARQMVAGTWPCTHANAALMEDEINRRGLWQEYIAALGITGSVTTTPPIYGWNDIVRALRAEPEQRARAFLAAIGERP
jgi:hypothetical protein